MPPLSRSLHPMPHPMDLLSQDGTDLGRTILSLLRGGRIEPQEVIRERSLRFLQDRFHIPLGSVYAPEQALFEGISCVGSAGSGKSVLIESSDGEPPLARRARAMVIERSFGHYKGNERHYLEGLELACPVHYVNPIRRRGKSASTSPPS